MYYGITYVNKKDLKTVSVSGWQVEETMKRIKENKDNIILFLDDHYIGDTDR